MNLSRTNIALACLLLLVALPAASINVDHAQPNYEFLPEMKRSPASDAFAVSSVFPNGRTLQRPVAGTIARGELPLYYAATKEDAVRAGEELLNPYQSNAAPQPDATEDDGAAAEDNADQRLQASALRGEQVYRVMCVSCHGPTGAGDGPVAKRGFPPPPPLTTGKSVQMRDGQLFHILTYGQGSMAPMAAQLSRDRRWDVINYVRSLQHAATPVEASSDDVPAEHSKSEEGNP